MDTNVELDIKSYRMVLLLGFIISAVVGCSSGDDIERRDPSIAQAYIHFCLSDDFDCDYPLPLRVLTTNSDISLGGTVFAELFNGVVTGTGGCFDPDGYPLWASPQTTITWSNTTTGEQGYGRTYWSLVVYGVCKSFWEVDNIPLTWGDNKLVFIGTSEGDDGRSAEAQAIVTRRPGKPENVEYVNSGTEHSFTWSEDLPGAASYNLYYSTTPGFTKDILVYVNDDTSTHVSGIHSPYVLTGLNANVNYYFAIAGITANGVIGVMSDEQSLMTSKLKVLSTFPMSEAIEVERDVAISITFNKEISSSSVNSSTFTLFDNNGDAVPATVSVTGNTVTLTPDILLSSDEMYSVTISGVIEDLYNNSLGSEYSWSFTAVDILAPSIQSYRPGVLEIDVFQNSIIEITFDEPIDCSTVNANSISLNPFTTGIVTCNSAVITFTPSILLDPNAAYVVTINAGINDLVGNPTLTDFSWSFITGTEIAWASTYNIHQTVFCLMGSAIKTADDSYVMVGYEGSADNSRHTFWSIKTDSIGNIIWERHADGDIVDIRASSVSQLQDGGFIVAGSTYEVLDPLNNYFDFEAIAMKLDMNGLPVWQKQYNNNLSVKYTHLNSIVPVSTGGYIAAGYSLAGLYERRALVIRLDDDGDILWQKQTDAWSMATEIQETTDGGYVFTGSVSWSTGDSIDLLVVKLDAYGVVSWQKRLGGDAGRIDKGVAIEQTSDGGYIVTGDFSTSNRGYDIWLLKLSASGDVEWQYTYGGNESDRGTAVRQTNDGGYIVAGKTNSYGAGNDDVVVLKLDMNGLPQWAKSYGNTGYDLAKSIEVSANGGYIIGGQSNGNFLALKIGVNGEIKFNPASGYKLTDAFVLALPHQNTFVSYELSGDLIDTSLVVNTIDIPFVTENSYTEKLAP